MMTRLGSGRRCPVRNIFFIDLHGGSGRRTTFILVALPPVTNLTLTRTTRKYGMRMNNNHCNILRD